MSNFVLWSGGYDSTLLLYELARDNSNELINAITIEGVGNSYEQQKAERKARTQLKKQIKFTNIQYHTIQIDYTNSDEDFQMIRWLSTVMPVLKNKDILNLAYLSSDGVDFFLLKPELEKAFIAFMELRDISCTIKFPFMYKTKGYVISQLKQHKLLKYVWTCGDPKKGKPCKKCMKCISIKRWTAYPDRGTDT